MKLGAVTLLLLCVLGGILLLVGHAAKHQPVEDEYTAFAVGIVAGIADEAVNDGVLDAGEIDLGHQVGHLLVVKNRLEGTNMSKSAYVALLKGMKKEELLAMRQQLVQQTKKGP